MLYAPNLSLVYMPIMNVNTHSIMSFEALLRVNNSHTEHVPYLTAAENEGWIIDIDTWVLNEVAKFLRDMGRQDLTVSINVSPVTIDHNLAEYLSMVMSAMDVTDRIIFEITETRPVLTLEKVNLFSKAIKLVSGRLSLDDFGEGHFLTLDILPETDADFIKLSDKYMCQAYQNPILLTELKSKLPRGCSLIAEFIDSKKKLDFLNKHEVEYAQGYLIGKPMSFSLFLLPNKVYAVG